MSVIHYNSGVFYAWIDGVLTTIPIGLTNNSIQRLNSPFFPEQEDSEFEPILFKQPIYDYTHKSVNNVFTGFNSFTSLITLLSGQISFPAAQSASAGANTLDDYEEGTWTPAITFVTPGDFAATYSTQLGVYTKIGLMVFLSFNMLINPITHTTAAGALRMTGLPFTIPAGLGFFGNLSFQGITKAGYTQISPRGIASTSLADFSTSGSGVGSAGVTTADVPTGGVLQLNGTIIHRATA